MSAMLTDAVALSESGVLVNGLSATDLLSGFQVTGEETVEAAEPEEAGPSPDFRGSGVLLRRLEAVRELVAEVLDARAEDPELTSANPAVPRTVFPWGIGIATSDVVVVGPDKDVTAAYLRMVGLRARTVDATESLRIAGELAAARSAVTDGVLEDPESEPDQAPAPEPDLDPDGGPRAGVDVDSAVDQVARRTSPRPGVVAAVGVAIVGVAAVAVAGMVVLPTGGTADAVDAADNAMQSSALSAQQSPPVQPDPADPADQWRDLTLESGHPRPQVTVAVDVPGWQVTDSSEQREIWTSDDAGMRVLTAAAPTPVGTQAELDAAMLTALEDAVGDGDDGTLVVTAHAPVDYEENFPESTTQWRVRLIDGHQVSIGCQYRDPTAARLAACDRFTATARVDSP